jgi:hypothetical protein
MESLEILLQHHGSHSAPEAIDPCRGYDLDWLPFFTPLDATCQASQVETVRYLLNLDPPWDIEQRGSYGNTSLFVGVPGRLQDG